MNWEGLTKISREITEQAIPDALAKVKNYEYQEALNNKWSKIR